MSRSSAAYWREVWRVAWQPSRELFIWWSPLSIALLAWLLIWLIRGWDKLLESVGDGVVWGAATLAVAGATLLGRTVRAASLIHAGQLTTISRLEAERDRAASKLAELQGEPKALAELQRVRAAGVNLRRALLKNGGACSLEEWRDSSLAWRSDLRETVRSHISSVAAQAVADQFAVVKKTYPELQGAEREEEKAAYLGHIDVRLRSLDDLIADVQRLHRLGHPLDHT